MGFDLMRTGVVVPESAEKLVMSVMVLDMSGSMLRYGDTPRKAVDEHVATLRKDQRAFYVVSVVGFNDSPTILVPPTEVGLVGPLESYLANGNTLLFKTVDDILKNLRTGWQSMSAQYQGRTRVVCGVFSDGADNRSPNPPFPAQVQETSRWARSQGWELSAFGIGIDAHELARLLGFDPALAVGVAATREGVRQVTEVHTRRTRSWGDHD